MASSPTSRNSADEPSAGPDSPVLSPTQQQKLTTHMTYFQAEDQEQTNTSSTQPLKEELRTAPLFSGPVLCTREKCFSQYGLLAKKVLGTPPSTNNQNDDDKTATRDSRDPRIFLNVSTPLSAFICGSQGSGKSHTLSCMLENYLKPGELGESPRPLAGIVFHWDRFTSYCANQICEAAYLCSLGIPARVLVSPTNIWRMRKAYKQIPGLSDNAPKPVVLPLMLKGSQLDSGKIMELMSVTDQDGSPPLYINVIARILREIAIKRKDAPGIDYCDFRRRLEQAGFSSGQTGPLQHRLQNLESFMHIDQLPKESRSEAAQQLAKLASSEDVASAWNFTSGSLTIVDLSCPFVDESLACMLFRIVLDIFLGGRSKDVGRVVALDEAHKFMTGTSAANRLTEDLLSVVRQQRHLATRVIVATQEPTISPSLLDLASLTIVHRFTSPAWMKALKEHLAGASADMAGLTEDEDKAEGGRKDVATLFKEIVELDAGEGLLFSSSAMLDVEFKNGQKLEPKKLGSRHVKIRVRNRLTTDGGRSILAT